MVITGLLCRAALPNVARAGRTPCQYHTYDVDVSPSVRGCSELLEENDTGRFAFQTALSDNWVAYGVERRQ